MSFCLEFRSVPYVCLSTATAVSSLLLHPSELSSFKRVCFASAAVALARPTCIRAADSGCLMRKPADRQLEQYWNDIISLCRRRCHTAAAGAGAHKLPSLQPRRIQRATWHRRHCQLSASSQRRHNSVQQQLIYSMIVTMLWDPPARHRCNRQHRSVIAISVWSGASNPPCPPTLGGRLTPPHPTHLCTLHFSRNYVTI